MKKIDEQVFAEIENAQNAYYDANIKFRELMEEFITERVKENGGSIDLSDDENGVIVVYDGGNHPEFASGFESVSEISIDQNGDVIVSCESGDENLDYFSTDDVNELYNAVVRFIEKED